MRGKSVLAGTLAGLVLGAMPGCVVIGLLTGFFDNPSSYLRGFEVDPFFNIGFFVAYCVFGLLGARLSTASAYRLSNKKNSPGGGWAITGSLLGCIVAVAFYPSLYGLIYESIGRSSSPPKIASPQEALAARILDSSGRDSLSDGFFTGSVYLSEDSTSYLYNGAVHPGTFRGEQNDGKSSSLSAQEHKFWSFQWCTDTKDRLAEELKSIQQLKFTLDGQDVPLASLAINDGSRPKPSGDYCYEAFTLLIQWPVGIHELKTTVTITSTITEAYANYTDNYPAGTYIFIYEVHVHP